MNDFNFALRQLLKNPGFSAVAVLTLALGIGANTAMFSLADFFFLRPLPVPRPDDLKRLYLRTADRPDSYRDFSYAEYQTLRDGTSGVASLLAHQMTMVGVTGPEFTSRAFADLVTANYFATLGVRLSRGREFLPDEESRDASVVIVSDAFWRKRGSDPELIGQTVRLNSRAFTVIGIAPRGFTGTTAAFTPDFWLPLGAFDSMKNEMLTGNAGRLSDPGTQSLVVVGRINPDSSASRLESRLAQLALPLKELAPVKTAPHLEIHPLPRFISGAEPTSSGGTRVMAVTCMAMSGIVLVVACLNLANMLLARGAVRRREIAIRVALGAGRGRIIGQLLLESLLLALLGGAGALMIGSWTTDFLLSKLAWSLPFTLVYDSGLNARVFLMSLGCCLFSTLLSGLVPTWKLSRTDIFSGLSGAQNFPEIRPRWWQKLGLGPTLVGGQLALSLALVTAAGLFIHSALNAAHANPGFRTRSSLLVEMDASLAGYDLVRTRQLYRSIVENVQNTPGVENVSLAATVPFGATHLAKHVRHINDPTNGAGRPNAIFTHFNSVGSDYFRTVGIPLLQGRAFTQAEEESDGPPRQVIIDDLLARQLWPGSNPIGQQIRFVSPEERHPSNNDSPRAESAGGEKPEPVLEVVGVVPWTRDNLGGGPVRSHIYVPFGEAPQASAFLHIKTGATDGSAEKLLVQTIRSRLLALDSRLPLLSIKPLDRHFADSPLLWMFQTGAELLTSLGGLALTLAAVGFYGLKAYLVSRRTREIGLRIALGALRRNVIWLVLKDALRLIALGLAWGLFLSYAIGQALKQMLFEVDATDPIVFLTGAGILVLTGVFASWIPARRAAKIDPMEALRYE